MECFILIYRERKKKLLHRDIGTGRGRDLLIRYMTRRSKENSVITGGQTGVRCLPAAFPAVDASEISALITIHGDVAIRGLQLLLELLGQAKH